MNLRPRLLSKLPAALLCFGLSLPALADPLLDQGRQRLDSGDARSAWGLLEPLESQRAGDPAYDFLLGLAALEMGQATRAIFAFERVLAVDPGNTRARAEIARAYLMVGEHRAAREEFERVRQLDVPPGVTATIDRLLALIQRAENRQQPSLKGFIELAAGNDSNVNSATDATTVAVPALGIATLNADSVKTGDAFTTQSGGLAYRHPVGSGHFLTGNFAASSRRNRNDTQFDTTSRDGSLGWQYARDHSILSLALAGSTFQRDGADLRDTIGFNAQWQRDYDLIGQGTLFFQYVDISYPGQSIRDVDREVLGAGYAVAIGPQTIIFGSFYGGAELEKAANVRHLGHKLGGLRLGAQHHFGERWSLLASGGFENREYGGIEPLFTEKRADDQSEFSLAANWNLDEHWKVGARASHVQNHSNIPVFAYTRNVYALNLRLEF